MLKVSRIMSLGAVAMLAQLGGAEGQGVRSSKHDLTAAGVSEVCVFCHTPHTAKGEVQAPLWNKPASGVAYRTYDSQSLDGAALSVGSTSVACLSCHDGTQSMDVVINAPKSGLIEWAGAALQGGAKFLTDLEAGSLLGTDLSDDHPIGIPYGGGLGDQNNAATAGRTRDPDFVIPESTVINGLRQWWIDTDHPEGATGRRDKQDLILYLRTDGAAGQPYVECATCHDPHGATENLFLRFPATGDDSCLACHMK